MTSQASLFFEDLHVGFTATSAAASLGRADIVGFATAYDPQPQHLDEALAAESMFGTLVASGWQTAALSMRLQLDVFLGRFPGGTLGAEVERLSWRRPVHPDEPLHVHIEVLALRPTRSNPHRGLVNLRTTTLNAADEAVMEMTATILVPRRPPPAS